LLFELKPENACVCQSCKYGLQGCAYIYNYTRKELPLLYYIPCLFAA